MSVLLIHVAYSGKTLRFNAQQVPKFNAIEADLVSLTGIPTDEQFLLTLDGVHINRNEPVQGQKLSRGSSVSDQELHVYLYHKIKPKGDGTSIILDEQPDVVVQVPVYNPPPALHHPLQVPSNSSKVRALPEFEHRFKHHVKVGEAYLTATEQRLQQCQLYVDEQHVQADALQGICAFVQRRCQARVFPKWDKLLEEHKAHAGREQQVLGSYHDTVAKMSSTELPSQLQAEGRRRLLDLISHQDLKEKVELCRTNQEALQGKVGGIQEDVDVLKSTLEAVKGAARGVELEALGGQEMARGRAVLQEQGGIVQALRADEQQVCALVEEMVQRLAQAGRLGAAEDDRCEALGIKREAHEGHLLPTLQQNDAGLADLAARCRRAKAQMMAHVEQQLAVVRQLDSTYFDLKGRLVACDELLKRASTQLAELRHMLLLPYAYRASLAECRRRMEWQQHMVQQAKSAADSASSHVNHEMSKRTAFLSHVRRYLPPDILSAMGLDAQPTPFEFSAPRPDPNLLPVSLSDLQLTPTFPLAPSAPVPTPPAPSPLARPPEFATTKLYASIASDLVSTHLHTLRTQQHSIESDTLRSPTATGPQASSGPSPSSSPSLGADPRFLPRSGSMPRSSLSRSPVLESSASAPLTPRNAPPSPRTLDDVRAAHQNAISLKDHEISTLRSQLAAEEATTKSYLDRIRNLESALSSSHHLSYSQQQQLFTPPYQPSLPSPGAALATSPSLPFPHAHPPSSSHPLLAPDPLRQSTLFSSGLFGFASASSLAPQTSLPQPPSPHVPPAAPQRDIYGSTPPSHHFMPLSNPSPSPSTTTGTPPSPYPYPPTPYGSTPPSYPSGAYMAHLHPSPALPTHTPPSTSPFASSPYTGSFGQFGTSPLPPNHLYPPPTSTSSAVPIHQGPHIRHGSAPQIPYGSSPPHSTPFQTPWGVAMPPQHPPHFPRSPSTSGLSFLSRPPFAAPPQPRTSTTQIHAPQPPVSADQQQPQQQEELSLKLPQQQQEPARQLLQPQPHPQLEELSLKLPSPEPIIVPVTTTPPAVTNPIPDTPTATPSTPPATLASISTTAPTQSPPDFPSLPQHTATPTLEPPPPTTTKRTPPSIPPLNLPTSAPTPSPPSTTQPTSTTKTCPELTPPQPSTPPAPPSVHDSVFLPMAPAATEAPQFLQQEPPPPTHPSTAFPAKPTMAPAPITEPVTQLPTATVNTEHELAAVPSAPISTEIVEPTPAPTPTTPAAPTPPSSIAPTPLPSVPDLTPPPALAPPATPTGPLSPPTAFPTAATGSLATPPEQATTATGSITAPAADPASGLFLSTGQEATASVTSSAASGSVMSTGQAATASVTSSAASGSLMSTGQAATASATSAAPGSASGSLMSTGQAAATLNSLEASGSIPSAGQAAATLTGLDASGSVTSAGQVATALTGLDASGSVTSAGQVATALTGLATAGSAAHLRTDTSSACGSVSGSGFGFSGPGHHQYSGSQHQYAASSSGAGSQYQYSAEYQYGGASTGGGSLHQYTAESAGGSQHQGFAAGRGGLGQEGEGDDEGSIPDIDEFEPVEALGRSGASSEGDMVRGGEGAGQHSVYGALSSLFGSSVMGWGAQGRGRGGAQ